LVDFFRAEELSFSLIYFAVIEQDNRIVQVNGAIIHFQVNRLLKSLTRGIEIVETTQCDSQVHIRVAEVRFQIDCHTKEVISRRILLSVQMNKSQIESCNPLEWVKVESTLQTSNCSDKFLFTKETHPNVVP
jgi:hypothetical protein